MAKYLGDDKTRRALAAYTNLVRATESVMSLLERQLRAFGLTMGQFRVLEALLHVGPMDQATLCDKVFCGDSNMTFLVGQLEKRGLIARRSHQRDKRRRVIHFTPEGHALIAHVFPLHAKVIRAEMSTLRGREQETLRRLCRKLGRGNPMAFFRDLTKWDLEGTV